MSAWCCGSRGLGDEDPVPVRGYMCFVNADRPVIGGAFTTRTVSILWPKKLASIISEPGMLKEAEIAAEHRRLAAVFLIA